MDDINKSSTPESPLEEISKWVEEHGGFGVNFWLFKSSSLLINEYLRITNDN
ncbi:MAG: hypothetical protein OSB08_04180 [SAR324 cluster bacterium]|nr:hypothetical protein [SAR324 cluster bacterium]